MKKIKRMYLIFTLLFIIIVIVGILLTTYKRINVEYDNNHVVKCCSDYFYCSVKNNDVCVYKINQQSQKGSKIYSIKDGIEGKLASDGKYLYLLNLTVVHKLDTEGNIIKTYKSDNIGFEDIGIVNNTIYLYSWSGIYTLTDFLKINCPPLINSFQIKEIDTKITIYGNDDIYLMKVTNTSDYTEYQCMSSVDGKYQYGLYKFYITSNQMYIILGENCIVHDLNDDNYKIEEISVFSDESYSKVLSDISSDNKKVTLECIDFKTSYFLMFSNTKYIGGREYNLNGLEVNDKMLDNNIIPINMYNGNLIYYDFKENHLKYDNNVINKDVKLSNFNSNYLFSVTDDKLFIFKVNGNEFNEIYNIVNLN